MALRITAIAALVVGTTALTSGAFAQTTLTMATVDAAGTLRNQLGNWVQDELEERSDDLSVRHIEGPVLGNAAQVRDQVAEGSVDIEGTDLAWLTPYSGLFQTTSFAFAFRDAEHLEAFFESDVVEEVIETIAQEQGLRILALGILPSRTFFTKKEMDSAEDFNGLKIRSPQLNTWIESYRALGANPTPVNWNETFLALKTGVVDAGHGVAADILPNQWHLAAPILTNLDDGFGVHAWFINEGKWQTLTEEQQQTLSDVMIDSVAWAAEQASQADIDAIVQMIEQGDGVFISSNQDMLSKVAAAVGEEKTKQFPAEEREKLRAHALEAARALEGTGDWWDKGVLDQIDAID